MYVCINCRSRIEVERISGEIMCSKCAGKILMKETLPITKRVSCD